jgi:hypothetical protein
MSLAGSVRSPVMLQALHVLSMRVPHNLIGALPLALSSKAIAGLRGRRSTNAMLLRA